jgi:predicted phosphodiesterase
MRIAIFSDVHGNALALETVLADVKAAGGVDGYWFVGDAASQGYDPAACVRRISSLPDLKAVRGNTDHYSTADTHTIDAEFVEEAGQDLARAQRTFAIVANFYWTRGAVTATGQYDWLANLPVEKRVELPDGTRVLLVHASPGTDEGSGITVSQSDDEVAALLEGADADLVIVGHTHIPLDRTVNGVRVWNLGSVSNPPTDDKRAMWTLLEGDAQGYRLERRYAAYDVARVLAALEAAHQPAAAVIRRSWERAATG